MWFTVFNYLAIKYGVYKPRDLINPSIQHKEHSEKELVERGNHNKEHERVSNVSLHHT